MQFLKTLFWVAFAVLAAVFSLHNWVPVSIDLWSGLTLDVKLPVLLVIGMLIGFLPTYAVHRTRMWSMRRKIDSIERNAAFVAASSPVPPTPAPMPIASDSPAFAPQPPKPLDL